MKHTHFLLGVLVAPVAFVGLTAVFASSVTVPNTFVAGTPAVAAEVNANFSAVAAAINDNDLRLTSAEARLDGIESTGLVQGAAFCEGATETVQRSFNNQGAAPTVTRLAEGFYEVTFPGFSDMNQRFYSITVGNPVSATPDGYATASASGANPTDSVFVTTVDATGFPVDRNFCLIVY